MRNSHANASGKEMDESITNGENLRAAYGQLCASYLAIDDFRGKLLQLLPVGTGIFLAIPEFLNGDAALAKLVRPLYAPLGYFGIAITIGLFALEMFGIRKCAYLIEAGKCMERSLGVVGQFQLRAPSLFGYISEPFAAGVIYPAVIAAWVYMALQGTQTSYWNGLPLLAFALLFLCSFAFIVWLHKVDSTSVAKKFQALAIKGG